MEVCKLKPYVKSNIWGGTVLKGWGKETDLNNIAETWELSFFDNACSIIDSGVDKGKILKEVVKEQDLGSLAKNFTRFPMLIKFLNTSDYLSVQVHPTDEYALKNENSLGKTECWYIVECEEDAGVYIGLKKDCCMKELKDLIKEDKLMSVLNHYKCKPGDFFPIPAGTIHTAEKGVTFLEVQQSSDITYRLYDYHRRGSDGKERELHIDKALDVIDLKKYTRPNIKGNHYIKCKYFSSYKYNRGELREILKDFTTFTTFSILSGEGFVNDIEAKKGDTFFVPAGQSCNISGDLEIFLSKIEK